MGCINCNRCQGPTTTTHEQQLNETQLQHNYDIHFSLPTFDAADANVTRDKLVVSMDSWKNPNSIIYKDTKFCFGLKGRPERLKLRKMICNHKTVGLNLNTPIQDIHFGLAQLLLNIESFKQYNCPIYDNTNIECSENYNNHGTNCDRFQQPDTNQIVKDFQIEGELYIDIISFPQTNLMIETVDIRKNNSVRIYEQDNYKEMGEKIYLWQF